MVGWLPGAPRRYLGSWVPSSSRAAILLAPERQLVGGKLGSSALWGFRISEAGMTGCGCTFKTVRTATRYRQLTPATLLTPTFFHPSLTLGHPIPPGDAGQELHLQLHLERAVRPPVRSWSITITVIAGQQTAVD